MDETIEGREVWIVAVSHDLQWRLAGVYSSEARAEAAVAHLRERDPGVTTSLAKFLVDEDLTRWWPGQNVVDV